MSLIKTIHSDIQAQVKKGIPEIKSKSDYKLASDSIAYLRQKIKDVEVLRKEKVRPLVEQKRDIDAKCKVVTGPAQAMIDEIKVKIADYHRVLMAEQLALEVAAKEAEPTKEVVVVEDMLHAAKHGDVSTTTVKKVVKYRIKDEKLRECISIKQTKLKELIGTRGFTMPDWIERYEEDQVLVRSKL